MHISSNKIQNVGKDFIDLFEDMQSVNYSVANAVIVFTFAEGFDLTFDDFAYVIKTILPNSRPIEGHFCQISFTDVEKEINRCLAFNPHYYWEEIPQETVNYRIKIYWDLIKKHFSMPPIVCYQYQPYDDSCFDFGIMWNFCFILLNAQGQGIILHAGAAD